MLLRSVRTRERDNSESYRYANRSSRIGRRSLRNRHEDTPSTHRLSLQIPERLRIRQEGNNMIKVSLINIYQKASLKKFLFLFLLFLLL